MSQAALQEEEPGGAKQGFCQAGDGGEDWLVGSPFTPQHAIAFAGEEGTENKYLTDGCF